ncbi:MAG: hypothetical protein PVF91_16100 [Chromatiales bacterium]
MVLLLPAGPGALAAGELAIADPGFWREWGDGRAELSGYDLTYPRYGEMRQGTAVTVFVTEPFNDARKVKSESRLEGPGIYPVMKLNLIQDFSTGIYDYNLMTSSFVSLEPSGGLPAGSTRKVSFSSQEWCGQVYAQALVDPGTVQVTSHSYFEKEADASRDLARPDGALLEDALLPWARGMVRPRPAAGETIEARILSSLELARLRHEPEAWLLGTLHRSGGTETLEVPAGSFVVDVLTAEVAGGSGSRTWTFWVEHDAPHRIIRWTRSDGVDARLLGTAREAYWNENAERYRQAVEALGLSPRPPRTP